MKAWIWRLGPAVVMMSLIFIASSMPGSEMPEFGIWDVLFKKGGHMIGYALLTIAYFHALTKGGRGTRLQFIIAICLAILYAVSDEWHQAFIPGRTATFRDVCIDAAGGMVGLALWHRIQKRRRSDPQKSAAP